MGLEAYRFMRADFGTALEHGRRAAAIAARSGDTKQRLHAHWGLACTLFHKGELRATMREMEVALGLYTPHMHRLFGVQDPGIMCLAYSSWALWELGRPDSALARINEAVAIARSSSTSSARRSRWPTASASSCCAARPRRRWRAPTPASASARRRASRCGWRSRAACAAACCASRAGSTRAWSRCARAMRMWLSTGAMVSQPLYLSLQTEGLMLAGELEGAAECVDEGLDIIERYGERQLEAELRRLRGEMALRRGDARRLKPG